MQELAPVLLRVSLALQYRKDWPTPITTLDFQRNLAMLTLGGTGYGYTALNQDIHGNFGTNIECQTNLQHSYFCIHECWACAHDHFAIYIKSAPVIRIFINE